MTKASQHQELEKGKRKAKENEDKTRDVDSWNKGKQDP
jgi:hypothetical protein